MQKTIALIFSTAILSGCSSSSLTYDCSTVSPNVQEEMTSRFKLCEKEINSSNRNVCREQVIKSVCNPKRI